MYFSLELSYLLLSTTGAAFSFELSFFSTKENFSKSKFKTKKFKAGSALRNIAGSESAQKYLRIQSIALSQKKCGGGFLSDVKGYHHAA